MTHTAQFSEEVFTESGEPSSAAASNAALERVRPVLRTLPQPMTALPRLIAAPRVEKCCARTVWQGESALLQTTFDYAQPTRAGDLGTLRQRLDRNFGIVSAVPRLIVGDVEVAYRDERALESIELRTAPRSWQRGPVDDVPADAHMVWVTFDVPYDQNGIFSLDVPVSLRWDALQERLALLFAPGHSARHWYKPADTISVATADDGTLVEMRFSAVEVLRR